MFSAEIYPMNFIKGEGIMTALNLKKDIIVIDPDGKKAKEIKKILDKSSMEKIAIINIKCLFNQFQEINKLMKNDHYLKMFYGSNKKSFDEIIKKFDSKGDDSIYYIGFDLKIQKVVSDYWKYRGFITFPATLSEGREI